jgi:hypothetical protein
VGERLEARHRGGRAHAAPHRAARGTQLNAQAVGYRGAAKNAMKNAIFGAGASMLGGTAALMDANTNRDRWISLQKAKTPRGARSRGHWLRTGGRLRPMKINVGDFGYKVPDGTTGAQAGAASFVQPGLKELGAAGQKVGAELAQGDQLDAQIAYREAHEKRVEAETVAKEAKRAEAMTIHARAQNDLAAEHDRIAQGVQDGSIGVDQAPKVWAESSTKIVDEHLKTVDKSNAELVRSSLVGNVGTFGRSINPGDHDAQPPDDRREPDGLPRADGALRAHRPGDGEEAVFHSRSTRRARSPGSTRSSCEGPPGVHRVGDVQRHEPAAERSMNDMGALQEFLKTLPEAKDLDPAKKNILESKAMTLITRLENKAVAAENRRLTQLKVLGDKLEMRIAMGVPIADTDLATYQTAAKGTIFEETANGLVDEQKTGRRAPSQDARRAGGVRRPARAAPRHDGRGEPEARQPAEAHGAVDDRAPAEEPAAVRDGPGRRAGRAARPRKPESWEANLGAPRRGAARAAGQVGGTMGALFPQEAAALAAVMQTGTPEQKKAFLEPLRRGLADDAIFRSTIQQVAKDSPVTALAAVIATKEAPLTYGRVFKESFAPGDTASLLLRGESMLNPTKGQKAEDGKTKGFPMPHGPDAQAMRTKFNDTMGEVFTGAEKAYDVQYEAARPPTPRCRPTPATSAARSTLAAGRAPSPRTAPVGKFNGKAVLMPWGMDEGRFKDRVADAFPGALKRVGLPVDMAGATGRYTLQNLTGNSYLVRQGTEYLTGPKGQGRDRGAGAADLVPVARPSARSEPSRSERLRPLPGRAGDEAGRRAPVDLNAPAGFFEGAITRRSRARRKASSSSRRGSRTSRSRRSRRRSIKRSARARATGGSRT